MTNKKSKIIVIGGGAAGFFAAIRLAESLPEADVTILERGRNVLEKVRISGGGRCNVTHACRTPAELIQHYPRGERELLSPFLRFATGDTVDWFDQRGVKLKIEEDGRMFPTSDDSQTIVDCLWDSATAAGVKICTSVRVDKLFFDENLNCWKIIAEEKIFLADKIIIATGSNPRIWEMLSNLGHSIVPPVPSLFTFNIKDARIRDLPGISVPEAVVKVQGTKLEATGPLLITHWGLSGPAILRLSAWGARELADLQYRFDIVVNWLHQQPEAVQAQLNDFKTEHPKKLVFANPLFGLPNRLWRSFVAAAGIVEEKKWADVNKKEQQALVGQLCAGTFAVSGKSTFKEEFVTAGGLDLKEINFKTFESKLFPGLYFAGEVLNIDAITGGFNFQAAWTGGWIAAEAIANQSVSKRS